MNELEAIKGMNAEWQAWQDVCTELKKVIPYDINDQRNERLMALIEKWGIELVKLRYDQLEQRSITWQQIEQGLLQHKLQGDDKHED